jgi:peptidase E
MIIALSNETIVMKHIADRIWRDQKLVYIDTASNWQSGDKTWLDSQIWAIKKEYSAFSRYSLEWKTISDFRADLSEYDIIHMWWGQTAYLLHHIMQTWFDSYLKEVLTSKIIIGSSAGAKVLGKKIGHVQALDDFSIADVKDGSALWLLNFDIWAHFWKEKYRKKYNHVLDIAYKNSQSWIYISDNSYIISTELGIEICNV